MAASVAAMYEPAALTISLSTVRQSTVEAISPQLPTDLPHAVDAEIVAKPPRTGRTLAGVDLLGDARDR